MLHLIRFLASLNFTTYSCCIVHAACDSSQTRMRPFMKADIAHNFFRCWMHYTKRDNCIRAQSQMLSNQFDLSPEHTGKNSSETHLCFALLVLSRWSVVSCRNSQDAKKGKLGKWRNERKHRSCKAFKLNIKTLIQLQICVVTDIYLFVQLLHMT